MNWPWFPPLSDADPHSLLFSIPLSLLISSIALALVLGIAAFFLEFVRKIGCKHSLERSTASDAFFEDPNSLKKKIAMLGGAITGALLSAVSNKNKDQIIVDAIRGGAVATAAEFLNYLT